MEGNRYVEKLVNLEPSACLGRNWFRVGWGWKERVWMLFPGERARGRARLHPWRMRR